MVKLASVVDWQRILKSKCTEWVHSAETKGTCTSGWLPQVEVSNHKESSPVVAKIAVTKYNNNNAANNKQNYNNFHVIQLLDVLHKYNGNLLVVWCWQFATMQTAKK